MWFIPFTHENKIFHFLELQLKKSRVNLEPGLSGYNAVEGLKITCRTFIFNVSILFHEM